VKTTDDIFRGTILVGAVSLADEMSKLSDSSATMAAAAKSARIAKESEEQLVLAKEAYVFLKRRIRQIAGSSAPNVLDINSERDEAMVEGARYEAHLTPGEKSLMQLFTAGLVHLERMASEDGFRVTKLRYIKWGKA
jgi:hypothetical protein